MYLSSLRIKNSTLKMQLKHQESRHTSCSLQDLSYSTGAHPDTLSTSVEDQLRGAGGESISKVASEFLCSINIY